MTEQEFRHAALAQLISINGMLAQMNPVLSEDEKLDFAKKTRDELIKLTDDYKKVLADESR